MHCLNIAKTFALSVTVYTSVHFVSNEAYNLSSLHIFAGVCTVTNFFSYFVRQIFLLSLRENGGTILGNSTVVQLFSC